MPDTDTGARRRLDPATGLVSPAGHPEPRPPSAHDVDTLRAAAAALREAAQKATPGPWGLGNTDTVATGVEQTSRGSFSCDYAVARLEADERYRWVDGATVDNPASVEDDGRYIVLAQPTVGLAVADWLDAAAAEATLGGVVDLEPLAVADAILTSLDALERALDIAEGVR